MYGNAFRVSGVFKAHQTGPSVNTKLPILALAKLPGILSLVSLSCCDGWKVLHTL